MRTMEGVITFVLTCCCCIRNYHKVRSLHYFVVSVDPEARHNVVGSMLGSQRTTSMG